MRRDHSPDEDRASSNDTALADDAAPLPRARRFGSAGTVVRIVGAAAVIATLSLFARETIRSHPPVPVGEGALAVTFTPSASLSAAPKAERAGIRLKLEEPATPGSLSGEPAAPFSEDSLTQGSFDAIESPHLLVTLSRGQDDPARSLFVTLVRRAADGPGFAVVRTGEHGRIDTKFGPMETIEATLAGETSRVCTGFATQEPRPVRIDGWLCAPLGQPPEPRTLACTLDRLVLDGPADASTEAVFRLAKARRDPRCLPPAGLVAAPRDAGIQTGSIAPAARPKNKATMRQKM